MKEVKVGLEKDHFQIIIEGMTEVTVEVGQGQDQEQVLTEIEIMGCKCREYDHFAKHCPTAKEEKERQIKIQQMFNLDEEHISLKTLATDTYDNLNHVSSVEDVRS